MSGGKSDISDFSRLAIVTWALFYGRNARRPVGEAASRLSHPWFGTLVGTTVASCWFSSIRSVSEGVDLESGVTTCRSLGTYNSSRLNKMHFRGITCINNDNSTK